MLEKIIKDYFSFSRKERIAVIILVLLIIIILLLPHLFKVPENAFSQVEINRIKSVPDQPGSEKKEYNPESGTTASFSPRRNAESGYRSHFAGKEEIPVKTELFYFDPNKLSSDNWKKLGLKDKTIQTIQNYISKGGHFKNKEDLTKIYGLRTGDAERLMPYVKIEQTKATVEPVTHETGVYKTPANEGFTRNKSPSAIRMVDINQADSAEFEALPGIGGKLATRILRFREKLGGFYSVSQLSEIYGLPDSTFQKIKPRLKINDPKLSLLNINTVEADELKQHPYFKWNVAAAIIEYRKQHGNYKTMEELRRIELVTSEIYEKITPYLKVE